MDWNCTCTSETQESQREREPLRALHSIEGTISPARSRLLSFCSADRRRSLVAASMERGGFAGGGGSGMNAETVSPTTALLSRFSW